MTYDPLDFDLEELDMQLSMEDELAATNTPIASKTTSNSTDSKKGGPTPQVTSDDFKDYVEGDTVTITARVNYKTQVSQYEPIEYDLSLQFTTKNPEAAFNTAVNYLEQEVVRRHQQFKA